MDAPLSPSSSSTASEPQPRTATSPLRALRTDTKLSPKSQTQQTRVHAALARIASVAVRDVVKEGGHRFFVIDVYFVKRGLAKSTAVGSSHQAPSAGTSTPSDPPDFQIKRRFSEFGNLRHELYYHAHTGHRHHKKPCPFCANAVDFLTHAPALPRLHKAVFQSAESLRLELDEFLGLVVQLASQAKNDAVAGARWCEGRAMVPLLVKKFVLGDEGEGDASVRSSATQQRPAGWAYATAWSA